MLNIPLVLLLQYLFFNVQLNRILGHHVLTEVSPSELEIMFDHSLRVGTTVTKPVLLP